MTTAFAYIDGAAAELVPSYLRSALFTLATHRDAQQSPVKALASLRVIVDVARRQIDLAGTAEEAHSARVRLTDAAVIGLLRFARAALDGDAESMIAPVSCVAIGNYASAIPTPSFAGGLLVLTEERQDLRARGEAIAGFMAQGLAELGVEIETFAKTVKEAVKLLALPTFAEWRRQRRLMIAGQQALFARFQRQASSAIDLERDTALANQVATRSHGRRGLRWT